MGYLNYSFASRLPNAEQIIHNDGLVNDTRMFALGNAHRRYHHQLNTMCLGVHFTFRKSIHFGVQVYFIVRGYGVFSHCEFHFANIVSAACPALQHQINLSAFAFRVLPSPTIVSFDGSNTQSRLNLWQMLNT